MGVYARRSSDQDKKRLSVDDIYEKRPKAYSLPIGGDSESDRLLASLPEYVYQEPGHVTAFDENQRKISMGMMAHLTNQGRKGMHVVCIQIKLDMLKVLTIMAFAGTSVFLVYMIKKCFPCLRNRNN